MGRPATAPTSLITTPVQEVAPKTLGDEKGKRCLPMNVVFIVCVCCVVDVADVEEQGCFLCESVVDVQLEPCNHAILCNDCAQRAKKCPLCRVSVGGTKTVIALTLYAV